MIIGVTGTLGAGKGTVSEILKKRGFNHYSVREFISEEIRKRGLEVSRDSLVFVANELRTIYGPSYIAERLYERAQKDGGDAIIESIRAEGEINALRQKGEFVLIAVDADPKVRYERAMQRKSETDGVSFERFMEEEKREMFSTDPTKQNLSKCISLSDFKIVNNGAMRELEQDVEEILRRKGFVKEKVKKREDYMGVSILSGKRSKDPNTQVGACIVNKDMKIVGIGYNGFPKGCSDEDFPWAREGSFLETKYAYVVHAELNAILNSMGRDLRDCTMYIALFPCNECVKAIIQSGIKRIVYLSDKYYDKDFTIAAKKMLDSAGVKCDKLVPKEKSILLGFE
jgi:dCMP deaminase